MNRLKSLEEWRISPSLLEFPEGGPESSGGFATVSRALLDFSYRRKESIHKAANGGDTVEGSDGRHAQLNDDVSNLVDNRESQQGDRVKEKNSPNYGDAAEGRNRESSDKALPGRKVGDNQAPLLFPPRVVEQLSNSDSGIKACSSQEDDNIRRSDSCVGGTYDPCSRGEIGL